MKDFERFKRMERKTAIAGSQPDEKNPSVDFRECYKEFARQLAMHPNAEAKKRGQMAFGSAVLGDLDTAFELLKQAIQLLEGATPEITVVIFPVLVDKQEAA